MFVYNCQILQYFTKLFCVLKAFNFQLNVNKKTIKIKCMTLIVFLRGVRIFIRTH